MQRFAVLVVLAVLAAGVARAEGDTGTFVIEQGVLTLAFHPATHAYAFTDNRTGRTWRAQSDRFETRAVSAPFPGQLEIHFRDRELDATFRCSVRLLDGGVADFLVDADDRGANVLVPYPPKPTADLGEGRLVFCNRSGGVYIPQDDPRHRGMDLVVYGNTSSLDMPWVGVLDAVEGDGVMVLLETPTGVRVKLAPDDAGRAWPQVELFHNLGSFRYARRMSYRFIDSGGYVAMARHFRAYARENGLFRTLREKQRETPLVDRLAGAIALWGAGLADGGAQTTGLQRRFALEARAAGIDRALISANAPYPAEDIRLMRDLGFLVSQYENFSDFIVGDGEGRDDGYVAPIEQAYTNHRGERQTGWLHADGRQAYHRAASETPRVARRKMEAQLPGHPKTARFIDVNATIGLLEDYTPGREADQRDDLTHRERLQRYFRDLRLVSGGEHGKAWAVPWLDYAEGMMSGPFWWQTEQIGHLIPVTSRDELDADYLAYGINPAARVPLWELVYHDCLATTWYWGDGNGAFHAFAPELSDRKDLFNILYGTMPLEWLRMEGGGPGEGFGWDRNRDRFLQTYYTVSPLHRMVLYKPMTDHAFLSDDGMVQRTQFGEDVAVTVNFGDTPWRCRRAGVTLAAAGFHVEADGAVYERVMEGEMPVTRIQTDGFRYVRTEEPRDDGIVALDGWLAAYHAPEGHWRVRGRSDHAIVDLEVWLGAGPVTALTVVDDKGNPVREVALERNGRRVTLPFAHDTTTMVDVVAPSGDGAEAARRSVVICEIEMYNMRKVRQCLRSRVRGDGGLTWEGIETWGAGTF